MSIPKDLFKNLNKDIAWIPERICFLTIHGSHAYGLNTPESDIDYRAICIPPKHYFLSFGASFDQYVTTDPDNQVFNIKKFFALTFAGNPNTLELLFTDPLDHIHVSDAGKILIENRDKFLSKQLKERYIGYAKAQAHRIISHRKFLLNPPENLPTRKEMGLPEKPLVEKHTYDAIKSLINTKLESWNPRFEPFTDSQKIYLNGKVSDILSEIKITSDDKWAAAGRTIGLSENVIELIKKEKEYENKINDYYSYMSWKKNRNPKRAELEAKFGMDLKHLTQLIRLLKLGKEVLETGKVNVKRTDDREELLGIKNGSMTYEDAIAYADKIEKEVVAAYDKSPLPNQPDAKYLNELCIKLIESVNYETGCNI